MIEKTVLDFLSDNLSCRCVMERDGDVPPFVRIEKTASGRNNRINSATIALQSYGRTLLEAAQLNEQVKAVADRLDELDNVYGAHLSSDYHFTDTRTKEYRYQAIYNINYIDE